MGGMPQPQAKNSARSIDAQMLSGKANLRATMCGGFDCGYIRAATRRPFVFPVDSLVNES
jgi:hypothetical protein